MALVTDGLLNKQIAGKMGISVDTAKIHRGSVMRKMESFASSRRSRSRSSALATASRRS
jgi:FixJ family two-component response regulator